MFSSVHNVSLTLRAPFSLKSHLAFTNYVKEYVDFRCKQRPVVIQHTEMVADNDSLMLCALSALQSQRYACPFANTKWVPQCLKRHTMNSENYEV